MLREDSNPRDRFKRRVDRLCWGEIQIQGREYARKRFNAGEKLCSK
jgi:hypothetical protein